MDMINNRFGILLAMKRMAEKRRISLSEVSKVTGISRQSLQSWENNTVTRFDLPIMDALCKYFDIQPGSLFQYVDNDLKITVNSTEDGGKVYIDHNARTDQEAASDLADLLDAYPGVNENFLEKLTQKKGSAPKKKK